MTDIVDVSKVSVEETQITREELAIKLEQMAADIRNKNIKSISVAMVAEKSDSSLYLMRDFVGINPNGPSIDGGYHLGCTIQGVNQTCIAGLYDQYVSCIELTVHEDPVCGSWTIGHGRSPMEELPVIYVEVDEDDDE